MYIVYILRTSANTLYTGQTNNLNKRILEHKKHKYGAKYLRRFENFKLVYTEQCESRSVALKREAELKGWSKQTKEKLIFRFGCGADSGRI